ncbi:Uncharacterised protein [Salmonella enterica subsp. enterica serovar Senftenberg]|nr:hypothetical protein SEES8400_07711 [Salmonella enterica subsp. enterica serovar Senftenberg str. ATCC 8400]SQI14665.1 Uncharacterised protein [Salmonella enterica subsp. enterica serovar Senftenberg]
MSREGLRSTLEADGQEPDIFAVANLHPFKKI